MQILIAEPYAFLPIPGGPAISREPGLHVSQLLGEIEQHLGFGPQDLLSPQDLILYQESGHMWEVVMEEQFVRRRLHQLSLSDAGLWLQPRLKRDLVHGTPDGLWLIEWCLLELKFLWRSPRAMDDGYREKRMWKVLHQIRSYLYIVSMEFQQWLLDCELIIGWVVGRYGTKAQGGYIHPHPMRYRLRFTQEELKQTWEMLLIQAYRHHPEWMMQLQTRFDKTGIGALR